MGKGCNQGSNKNWFNWLTWKTREDSERLIQMNYIRKDVEVGDKNQENEPEKTAKKSSYFKSNILAIFWISLCSKIKTTYQRATSILTPCISLFWKGVLFSALSGLSFTFNTAIFKYVNCDSVDTMFIRSMFQILVLTIWNKFQKNQFFFGWTKDQALVLTQAFASSIFVFATYGAMMSLEQGDAMTIIMASPFFTIILQRFIPGIRKKISLWPFGCLIMLLLGVVLNSQPALLFGTTEPELLMSNLSKVSNQTLSDSTQQNSTMIMPEEQPLVIKSTGLGIFFAIVAALGNSINGISTNQLTDPNTKESRVPTMVCVWYTGLTNLPLCFLFYFFDGKSRLLHFQFGEITIGMWLGMLAIAFLGLLGFCTNTASAKLLDPTTLSFFKTLQIVMGEISQICFFKSYPNILGFSGTLLVVSAVIMKGVQDKMATRFPKWIKSTDSEETPRI